MSAPIIIIVVFTEHGVGSIRNQLYSLGLLARKGNKRKKSSQSDSNDDDGDGDGNGDGDGDGNGSLNNGGNTSIGDASLVTVPVTVSGASM